MNSSEPSDLPPSENPNQPENDSTQPPPFLPKLPPRNLTAEHDPYGWLKWILAQNPFYIASAILLLYAVFRLSTDSKIFAEEVSQLFFNFGSFEVYEIMLAATAVVLVRRKILYDFSLLVCIESMFAFVPFILITQASLIENEIAWVLSLAGSVLILLRFGNLKKHFGGMNFPPRLLLLGGVLLCVNVMLPLAIRYIHMKSGALNRDLRLNPTLEMLWLFGAPLFAGLAYFLPAPQKLGPHLLQRRTFPMTLLSLWVLVTCAHLYAVGYIHQVAWNDWYLVPVIWMAAWMFYLRRRDVFETIRTSLRNFLLALGLGASFLAAREHQWTMLFVLGLLNAVFYGRIFLTQRTRFAFQLTSISCATIVAGIPNALLLPLHLDVERGSCIGASITGYLLLQTSLSRNPKAGLLGGVVASIASGVFFRESDYFLHIAAQVGVVFLLIHSLRWELSDREARGVRLLAAGVWVAHSIIWTATGASIAMWATNCFALTIFASYLAVRVIFGAWSSRLVPYASALVLLSTPSLRLFAMLKGTPVGLLVLIASFVLFALGTLLALTRHRWQKAPAVVAEPHTK